MQKREWSYYGRLKPHYVQLLHFVGTGRATLRVNGAVMFDENLPKQESKMFTFFVDDELCQVSIVRQPDGQFIYDFKVHEHSSSKTGKKMFRRDRLEKIGLFSAIILVLAGMSFFVYQLRQNIHKQNDLSLGGMTALATIVRIERKMYQPDLTPFQPKTKTVIYYRFGANGHSQMSDFTIDLPARNDTSYTPAGLPLLKDDEFEVLFEAKVPENHLLRLEKPSEKQLQYYWLLARRECMKNKEITLPDKLKVAYCDCLIHNLFNKQEISALASIYNQHTDPQYSPKYNRNTYNALMQDREQRILMQDCLEKINQQ